MKTEGWPTYSFTECLRPPDGWTTRHAILSTYSADLTVVVTALLALSGCEFDLQRTGSRVELVQAIEGLRGRACVLAQAGRVLVPNTPRPILKLLDQFTKFVGSDERSSSWHPKAALVCFQSKEDESDRQWRLWLGSRNLTRSSNWEAGLNLVSRSDGKGQHIPGLVDAGVTLAKQANLPTLSAKSISEQLTGLTWECPAGVEVERIDLLIPGKSHGFPLPPNDTELVYVVNPFIDLRTAQTIAKWGGPDTRRTLVSTRTELQRLSGNNKEVFADFLAVRVQPSPDLPAEYADVHNEETVVNSELLESESLPPSGLHAKLFLAIKGARRQLWLGSANATARGWLGGNSEIVAQMRISRDAANGLEDFVSNCEEFVPSLIDASTDEDEMLLEEVRKTLSVQWELRQEIREDNVTVISTRPPLLSFTNVLLEIALLGEVWKKWPTEASSVTFSGMRPRERSDFIQIRISVGEMSCSWLQIATCHPRPDDDRDHAIIAGYLDAHTFIMWIRSLLADDLTANSGSEWDAEDSSLGHASDGNRKNGLTEIVPSIEEVLRAWTRDSSAFTRTDEKVKAYLNDLQQRVAESGKASEIELLTSFRSMWESLASELA
jgi:hypothetical protein